jgi:hypothetical protein
MHYKGLLIVLGLLCLQNSLLVAQNADSSASAPKADHIWNIDGTVSIDFPLADMAKRFGTSSRIGFGIKNKTRTNWTYGAKFEFIIGKKVHEDSLLYGVKTAQGGIIGQSGDLINPGVFERGYVVGIQVGKIFSVAQANKNSGPMLLLSSGFMQHRIKLFDKDLAFPQLNGEYKKGYDRLTNGWYLEELIGYNYFSTDKLINFYAGFNLVQGFTKGRRSYLYDVKRPDDAARKDFMWGFKLGWVISIYRKESEETYY